MEILLPSTMRGNRGEHGKYEFIKPDIIIIYQDMPNLNISGYVKYNLSNGEQWSIQ